MLLWELPLHRSQTNCIRRFALPSRSNHSLCLADEPVVTWSESWGASSHDSYLDFEALGRSATMVAILIWSAYSLQNQLGIPPSTTTVSSIPHEVVVSRTCLVFWERLIVQDCSYDTASACTVDVVSSFSFERSKLTGTYKTPIPIKLQSETLVLSFNWTLQRIKIG